MLWKIQYDLTDEVRSARYQRAEKTEVLDRKTAYLTAALEKDQCLRLEQVNAMNAAKAEAEKWKSKYHNLQTHAKQQLQKIAVPTKVSRDQASESPSPTYVPKALSYKRTGSAKASVSQGHNSTSIAEVQDDTESEDDIIYPGPRPKTSPSAPHNP